MNQIPTVGRTVHYQSYGTPNAEYKPMPRAAVITEVGEIITDSLGNPKVMNVGVCVLNPTGFFFNQDVPYSEIPKPGHWNWPPRS